MGLDTEFSMGEEGGSKMERPTAGQALRSGSDVSERDAAEGAPAGRLIRLQEEFERRQRRSPELVVRPWFSGTGPAARERRRDGSGFVVEYCPGGVESVELAIRPDRVRAEGPGGVREESLGLDGGWFLGGHDRHCPETLANHLLHLADGLLNGAGQARRARGGSPP